MTPTMSGRRLGLLSPICGFLNAGNVGAESSIQSYMVPPALGNDTLQTLLYPLTFSLWKPGLLLSTSYAYVCHRGRLRILRHWKHLNTKCQDISGPAFWWSVVESKDTCGLCPSHLLLALPNYLGAREVHFLNFQDSKEYVEEQFPPYMWHCFSEE